MIAGRRRLTHDPPRSGPAGPGPKFLSKFIFGPEPDGRIRRKKKYTRPTDSQKIDFLKIYISRFFQAKICLGPPPEHAQIIPK